RARRLRSDEADDDPDPAGRHPPCAGAARLPSRRDVAGGSRPHHCLVSSPSRRHDPPGRNCPGDPRPSGEPLRVRGWHAFAGGEGMIFDSLRERLFYESLRIRKVEERIVALYPSDRIQSPVHLSIGQEAVAVGTCAALEPEDLVFGSYRSHAFYL